MDDPGVLIGRPFGERISRPRPERNAIHDYVFAVWDVYRRALRDPAHPLVRPSIPIAWFGDLEAYARSPIRIVTVGLNPSRAEFPSHEPYLRFSASKRLSSARLFDLDVDAYVESLNCYFVEHPYRRWFDGAYRGVLAAMDATFYPSGGRFSVLHTDLFSPLATDPTWSKLARWQRRALSAEGVPLWRQFIEIVAPDLIIASVGEKYIDAVGVPDGGWDEIYVVKKKLHRRVRAAEIRIGSWSTILVHAPAQTLPFGPFSAEEKRNIGVRMGLPPR